jgi:hypothetical protein
LPSEFENKLREQFLEKFTQEYPSIKEIYIDVCENHIREIKFFASRGFTIWETSTAPVGKTVVNVHLMQKILPE